MPDVVRLLKDGYWDRTSVVRAADGSLRVRKESKPAATPGPWAHEALRREIEYLKVLPRHLESHFPPLLDSWDGHTIGYEMPYYEDRSSFLDLLRDGKAGQGEADEMQRQLANAVIGGLHGFARRPGREFAAHVRKILADSIEFVAGEERFRPLAEAAEVVINDKPARGLRASFGALVSRGAFEELASQPSLLLHGDLILENILWPPLLLIDPVSVAALAFGHPLFDLVKYESFATGDLYAIREELVTAQPSGAGYHFEIHRDHSELAPFRRLDLTSAFRAAYAHHHGAIDRNLYTLLDAYFSLVMARNTTGTHQWARVLRACQSLDRASNPS